MIGALLDMPANPRRQRQPVQIGPRLKHLRERYEMTQEEVAARLGMSTDGYRHREHGRSKMLSISELQPLAGVYGLTVPELLVELGFVPPDDRLEPSESSLTAGDLRRRLAGQYPRDVVLTVTRLLDAADEYSENDVSWLAEVVQASLDRLKRNARRDE